MAARVDVYGGVRALMYKASLVFNAPLDPIVFGAQNGDVIFAKMVAVFACVLHHGRLIVAHSIGGG